MKSCCFTGHRPHKLPFGYREDDPNCISLKSAMSDLIRRLVLEKNVRVLYSGMALGSDLWNAESVLDIQKVIADVSLYAVIPSIDQTEMWNGPNAAYKQRYQRILDYIGSEHTIFTSTEAMAGKTKQEMSAMYDARNHLMVDRSNYLIACWTGEASGTSKTIRYAVESGHTAVYILNPYTPSTLTEIEPGDVEKLSEVQKQLKEQKAAYKNHDRGRQR